MNSKEINNFMFFESNKARLNLLWGYLAIGLFLILVIITFAYDYELFYKNTALVTKVNNSYYVKVYVKENDIYKLNNKYLQINNNKYSYNIESISNEYYLDNNTSINYREVILNTNLPSKYLIENNVIDINIKYKKIKLMRHILNIMFGKER